MNLNQKINTRKAGVFSRWAASRKLFSKLENAANSGRKVYFLTSTRATLVNAKHFAEGMIKAGRDGLYVQRGKRWDYLGDGVVWPVRYQIV